MRRAILAVASIVGASCAHSAPGPREVGDAPQTGHPAGQVDLTRYYTIWLGGARVGTATEMEDWDRSGVTLTRREQMHFRRGDADVSVSTSITIDADTSLVARRVRWSQTGRAGDDTRTAEATRGPSGAWLSSNGAALATNAVPAELVPLLVRRDGAFRGTIFLPARGFVSGTGRIDAVAPDRMIARLALDGGAVAEATIDLDPERTPQRVVDGEGVIAMRASEVEAQTPFEPVDVIAATAITIGGQRGASRVARLLLHGDVVLPALPGQRAHPVESGIELELSPALPGALPTAARTRDRLGDIRLLVTAVRQRVTPDLGRGPMSVRDAESATAGDCTTFALTYAARASERAIETRVITGLRIDGSRLVRHRWAVSWTGSRWIAIDAAFAEVPAGGALIGLAVHDADDAGLVAGDAALTSVRAATWR